MKKAVWLLGAALSLSLVTPAQEIKEKEVRRLVSTLAADDMEGRYPGTPGIEKAASFISDEFKQAGLSPLPGESSFLQKFNKYYIGVDNISFKVNGKKKNWVVVPIGNSLRYDWVYNEDDYIILHIKDKTELLKALRRTSDKNRLIWLDPSMAGYLSGLVAYYSEGVYESEDALNTAAENAKKGKQTVLVVEQSPVADGTPWEIHINRSAKTKEYANVAGMIKGKSKPDEYVVFSAHYDHLGILPAVAGDSIANGADDDASGTTAVIMLSKYFSQQQPERSVIFVAFTAEESGGYGSRYFSEQLDPDKVVAMFNIEMIGKESKFGKNSAFITGFERSDFGPILQRNLQGSEFKFYPDPYPEQDLFYRSDNATLAKKGVPAHSISTTQIDKDQCYHTVDDETETLDTENITSIINAIAVSASSIIKGTDTPTRIEKSNQ